MIFYNFLLAAVVSYAMCDFLCWIGLEGYTLRVRPYVELPLLISFRPTPYLLHLAMAYSLFDCCPVFEIQHHRSSRSPTLLVVYACIA
jgi:hypothetical protein